MRSLIGAALLIGFSVPAFSCEVGAIGAQAFGSAIGQKFGKAKGAAAAAIVGDLLHKKAHELEAAIRTIWRNDNHRVKTTFASINELYFVLDHHKAIVVPEKYRCTVEEAELNDTIPDAGPVLDSGLLGTGVDVVIVDGGPVDIPQGSVEVINLPSSAGGGGVDGVGNSKSGNQILPARTPDEGALE